MSRGITSSSKNLARNLLRRLATMRQDRIITVPSERRLSVPEWTFIIFVLVPTLVAAAYLSFMASSQYVAEARFAIRTAVDSTASANAADPFSFISSFTNSHSTMQDAYIVSSYIRSRTIIEDLGGKKVLHKIFSRPDVDWFSRLPSSGTLEELWDYWKNKVDVLIDTPTGIITLYTCAFTPGEAQHLAATILQRAERLVNQISERSRSDALHRAEEEVQSAQDRLRVARESLAMYRNRTSVLDPEQSARDIGQMITTLYLEKVRIENEVASVSASVGANSPTSQINRARLANLDKQIASLQDKLTSERKNSALSDQIAGYETSQLHVQFAEKLYSIAQASYERAREAMERQQLYFVTIVPPILPEQAKYPRHLIGTLLVFAVCLVLWSMVSLVIAAIRDHMA